MTPPCRTYGHPPRHYHGPVSIIRFERADCPVQPVVIAAPERVAEEWERKR